jgi:hypothetical protein
MVFKLRICECVSACVGYVSDEDMQPLEVVIEEDIGFSHEIIDKRQTQKFVIREEETTLSHKRSQREDYTQSKNENVEGKVHGNLL